MQSETILAFITVSNIISPDYTMSIQLKNDREIWLVRTIVRKCSNYEHWASTENTKKLIEEASNWKSTKDKEQVLAMLRSVYNMEDVDHWDRFAVALELAWHKDSTGLELLRKVARFDKDRNNNINFAHMTSSGFEIVDSAVGLLLLGEKLPPEFRFKNQANSLAYRFLDELASK